MSSGVNKLTLEISLFSGFLTIFTDDKENEVLAMQHHMRRLSASVKPFAETINPARPTLNDYYESHLFLKIFKEGKQKKPKKKKKKKDKISEVKIAQLSKQPIIESLVSKSEDGKWLIHKTTITDIKPVSYFEKVLGTGS